VPAPDVSFELPPTAFTMRWRTSPTIHWTEEAVARLVGQRPTLALPSEVECRVSAAELTPEGDVLLTIDVPARAADVLLTLKVSSDAYTL
jgi:hypothetical protein